MTDSWTFPAENEQATIRLGEALAAILPGSITIALIGTLGAGKTRFVRAVAEAAGADRGQVNSPTFVLVQEYEAKWPIYHFDTYRLQGDLEEFLALGAEEYLASAGVCFIEWADRVSEILPADHIAVEIKVTGETSRNFTFHGTGPRSVSLIEQLAHTYLTRS